MTPERWKHVERLYHAALELAEPERGVFLAQACGADEELRREVESLLAAHDRAGSFIAENAVADHADRFAAQPSNEDQPTAMLPNPLSNSSQRTINQYRIVSLLGKGGMGEVWLAEDTRLKRKVALKLLPAEFTNDAERLRRFEQEALAISALNHPNIITIHEIGEDASGRFIVMELVAGRTLRALAAEPVAPNDLIASLIAWGIQLAKALHAAHAAGITHRDIKPENIMVREDGYVKVLDFGLARLAANREDFPQAESLSGTQPGMLLGTVKYMSPEQARGEKVTSATDIFALGILFYELATGAHPFNSPTLLGALQQITSETPQPPSRLNPEIPAAFESLISRMLAKQAEARPSAAEIAQALLELSGQRGSGTLQRPTKPAIERHTVGHEKERAELRSGFASALNGRGQLLCITGEPGIGKTTLVEDFLAELAVEGQCTIARGRCSERLAGTEAYLPLLEALESLLQSGGNPAAARVMKQIAPTWYAQVVPLSGESEGSVRLLAEVRAASQERMKRELGNFLQEVARLRPLVLFFDDLHWADVSTIDVLSFLAGKFDALNALIVVTYRPSDMLLVKHPFLQIKPDLQARGVCRELLLEFLNEAEIAEYLALKFPGHRFPSEFPKLIQAKTEGSPLFMADLVRYLRDRGVIANTSGVWMLAQALPDIERELPESVRGMIERKIAQLSEDDRKLLTAASVQGYEFDSAVVAQVLSLEADEVEERLEKLERVFAFVKSTSETEFPNRTPTLRYRFVHVLYQNALYGDLRVTRRASLSAAVAHSLLEFYGAQSQSIAGGLANLFEAARDFVRATEHFAHAARDAAQINAHREAVGLFRRGLESLNKLPETPERNQQEIGLQLALGLSAQSAQGWTSPEVAQAFSHAHKLCQPFSNDPNFFAALFGIVFFRAIRAEYLIVRELLTHVLDLALQSNDPVMLTMAYFGSGAIHYFQGELLTGNEQLRQAMSFYQLEKHKSYLTFLNEDVGVTALRSWGQCLWLSGYPDQALSKCWEAMEQAQRLAHPFTNGGAHNAVSVVHFFRREYSACLEQAERVVALAREYDLGEMKSYGMIYRALAIARLGNPEEGLHQLQQAIADFEARGSLLSRSLFLMVTAELYGLAKQPEAGLGKTAEALAFIESSGEYFFEAEAWRIKGGLLLLANKIKCAVEAEACYLKAIEIARRQSAKSLELRAVTSLARLWQQQGKLAEAQQMLAEIYGWFTEGFDTADLKDAKALLDELASQVATTTAGDRRSEFNLQVAAVYAEDKLKLELLTPVATSPTERENAPSPSIAVLPFVNMSADPENEYFCDGLAEELLNALSKIEALRVAARTSAFSFKGKETDIREIGQKLNVGAVLEGSVRKAGNRLRITAQLVNVADGYHLWSERYDRQMQDIFDIQDEISLAIVAALKVKLLGAEKAAVTKRYTDNTEAYQLYLMGRFHFSKVTEDGFRKAIEYFEQATAIESNYALALAGLADSWLNLWWNGYLPPSEGMLKAKAASDKVLAVDAALAESHVCMAQLKFYYEWDFPGASQEFKQAIALNPNYVEAHGEYGLILSVMGRAAEAEAEAKRSTELDPLSLITNFRAGWIYYALGQSNRVLEYCRKMIEIEPNFFGGYSLSAIEAWRQERYEQAITEMQAAVTLGEVRAISFLGCLYGITGEPDKARQMLGQLQDLSAEQYVPSYYPALIYAGLSETDNAFKYLEQSYEQREAILVYLKFSASLIPGFSADPRLADLLRRIGLPQ